MTRAEIHEAMMHLDEKIAALRERISRAKSDLFHHNKPHQPVMFRRWQREETELKVKRQRLQWQMGEAKRAEKQSQPGKED